MVVMADVQETRNALWRRDEQIQRWNLSETNLESTERKNRNSSKIKFQDGCVFLAACSSGDTDEVESLITKGADINTANIDGLTALHQACIDDNVDMVEFLIDHNADINACDNEGWTPLHATASCGFIEVARFLIEKGANLAAVNNEGELAYDLADGDDMEDLISKHMDEQGIDVEAARNEEEEIMLQDANQWLNSGRTEETPHPKTGATALHVAAAKGYIKVMLILIQAKADIDGKDFDGWTPLHAAAHWGQEEACKTLVDNMCNMEARNRAGQTPFDVADPDLESLLEQLKKKQATLKKDKEESDNKLNEIATTRNILPAQRRMSVDQKQNLVHKTAVEERAQLEALQRSSVANKVEEEGEERSKSSEDSQDDDAFSGESSSSEESSSADEDSSEEEEVTDKKTTPVGVETAKRNEHNKQVSSLPATTQVNGDIDNKKATTPITAVTSATQTPTPAGVPTTTATTPEAGPPSKTTTAPTLSSKTTTAPTPSSQTPRIHDLTDSSKTQRDQASNSVSTKPKAELSSDKVSAAETKKITNEREKGNVTIATDARKKDTDTESSQSLQKEEQKTKIPEAVRTTKSSSLSEDSSRLSSSLTSKSALSRTASLPNPDTPKPNQTSSRPASFMERQSSLSSDGPSSWRAGLRKTPSSSAVPETTSRIGTGTKRDSSSDKLLRSASSSWIVPDKNDGDAKKRLTGSTGTGDSQDAKARFSDFYSRYTTLLGSITSSDTTTTTTTNTATNQTVSKPTITSSVSGSISSTSAPSSAASTPSSSVASSSSYNYTPYMPLSRRRPMSELGDDKTSVGESARSDRHSTIGFTTGTGRRSFEPPKRDEEKEVERKAKAKRARESRRSTQGVTREDLERAEKSLQAADKTPASSSETGVTGSDDRTGDKENQPEESVVMRHRRAHITPTKDKKEVDESALNMYRKSRDSSILFDNAAPSSSQYTRSSVRNSALSSTPSTSSSSVGGVVGSTATTTVISSTTPSTTPFRTSHRSTRNLLPPPSPARSYGDSSADNHTKSEVSEKEDPSQKSSAIRTRRKRESRRPTGKVTLEDIQQASEDQTDSKEPDDKKDEDIKSSSVTSHGRYGSRFTDPSSSLYGGGEGGRYGGGRGERASSASSASSYSRTYSSASLPDSKSNEVDYKKLYEEEKQETEKLKREIKKIQQDLVDTKSDLDKYKSMYESNRSTESSSDKREKRALERKISELEEELKGVEKLKSDNQRLKDENGALIRVISKLSK